jgi:hypothetical protein
MADSGVADMACGFNDMLADTQWRLDHGNLLFLCPWDAGKLPQVRE